MSINTFRDGPAPDTATIGGQVVTLSDGPAYGPSYGRTRSLVEDFASDVPNPAPALPAPKPAVASAAAPTEPTAPPTRAAYDQQQPASRPVAANPLGIKSVFARIRPEIADVIGPFKQACEELRGMRIDLDKRGLATPDAARRRIEEAEASLPHCASPEECEAVALRISTLKGITPRICDEAGRACHEKALALQEIARAILDAAEARLKTVAQEVLIAELGFFEEVGIPHEPTAASRVVEAVQSRLKSMRVNLGPLPGEQAETHEILRYSGTRMALSFDPHSILSELIGR